MYERPSISNILFSILSWNQNNHVNAAKLFPKRIFICHPLPPPPSGRRLVFALCRNSPFETYTHVTTNTQGRTNAHTLARLLGSKSRHVSRESRRKCVRKQTKDCLRGRDISLPDLQIRRMAARIILANVQPNEVSLHIMPSSIYMYVRSQA